jgi:hypothetical protein
VAPGPISDTVAPGPMNPRSDLCRKDSQSIKSFLAIDQRIKFLPSKVEASTKNTPCSIRTPTHGETPKSKYSVSDNEIFAFGTLFTHN